MTRKLNPKLGDEIVSENYQLVKLHYRTDFHYFDNDKDYYILDLQKIIDDKEVQSLDKIKSYLERFSNNKEKLVFKREDDDLRYGFDRVWTKRGHILRIEKFSKDFYEYAISTLLGPLSKIPTSQCGVANYVITHNGEQLRFQSFAHKKTFTIRPVYWVSMDVYYPQEQFRDEVDMVLLDVSEPNHFYDDNGMYLVLPREK